VRFLFAAHAFGCFATTVLFDCAQTHQSFLSFTNICFGNLASLVFFGAVACFSFDSLPFVFSASARDLFFLLMPPRLLSAQPVFCCHPGAVNFRTSRRFLAAQAFEFNSQLGDLFSDAVRDLVSSGGY
jgi:hypothetical protein